MPRASAICAICQRMIGRIGHVFGQRTAGNDGLQLPKPHHLLLHFGNQ